jgi:hypothetical protein
MQIKFIFEKKNLSYAFNGIKVELKCEPSFPRSFMKSGAFSWVEDTLTLLKTIL